MKLCLRIALLVACLAGWTVTQDGFDLADAFDDDPKPATPKPQPEKPKVNAGGGGGVGGDLDLSDAFGPEEPEKPKKPAAGDNDNDMGFDLADALGPDPNPKPDPPAVVPPKSGEGGGSFDDSDLMGVGEGDYKPDGGRGGAGGRAADDPADNAADQPQAEAGSGQIAGIASAIGVAIMGAATSYFAYQKKKLCFKIQGGVDPESGKGAQSDPQVMSNLLQSSS